MKQPFVTSVMVLALCCLGGGIAHSAASLADPLQRLVAQIPDSGTGADNVALYAVEARALPPYIAGQLAIAANCTGDAKNASLIRAYSYASDHNRAQKLAPNYILDMGGLQKFKFKNCSLGELCKNGQCALIGFSADQRGWKQTFLNMMTSWTIKVEKKAKTAKTTQTKIVITAATEGQCSASDEKPSADGTCTTSYLWHDSGLVRP